MAKVYRFPVPPGCGERSAYGADHGGQPRDQALSPGNPYTAKRRVWRASRCKPLLAIGWLLSWLLAGVCTAPLILLFWRP